MATVLKRPMFRMGGPSSDGVGILSGLKRHGFADTANETVGMQAEEMIKTDDGGNIIWGESIEDAIKKIGNPDKAKYGWGELIKDAYRTSKDAASGKEWLTNAADLALERSDAQKAEKKALPGKVLQALTTGRSSQADWIKATKPSLIDQQRTLMTEALTMLSEAGDLDTLINSKKFAEFDMKMSMIMDNWKPAPVLKAQLMEKWQNMEMAPNVPYPPEVIKEKVKQEMRQLYEMYIALATQASSPGNAMGGTPRNRYAMGMGPVMEQQTDTSMTENIQTPQGDMSMTENVDTFSMGQQAGMPSQTMPSDDPFVLLRARLPEEITDDVVRLIAYNPEAFADFADIETQEDVISFNKKYGVELVVNTDEMSGAIA